MTKVDHKFHLCLVLFFNSSLFYFPALKDHQHQLRGVRGKVAGSPGWPTHKVLNVDEDEEDGDGDVGGVGNDGEVMPFAENGISKQGGWG